MAVTSFKTMAYAVQCDICRRYGPTELSEREAVHTAERSGWSMGPKHDMCPSCLRQNYIDECRADAEAG
jgi:CO dehydrogenase/acetyl-CoA synthase alpha subunit